MVQIAYQSTGRQVKAENLRIGSRVLLGVSTKIILNVTTKDNLTYVKVGLGYGKFGYRTFPANRIMFVY